MRKIAKDYGQVAPQTVCEEWNRKNPIGTNVMLKKDFQDDLTPTKTRSLASVMCGSPVVWLEGVSGCYSLTHVFTVADADAMLEARKND